MDHIMMMAGELTAHAIWNVSSGETLIPIIAQLKSDGTYSTQHFDMDPAQAIALGEKTISNLDSKTLGASFIKDAPVTLETGKTDALTIDIRFSDDTKKIRVLIPYRHAEHPEGFAVHRLQATQFEGISNDVVTSLANSFFDGINSHTEASKIWVTS